MSFLRLPNELLSRVCRFIGLDREKLRYQNKDFQSLRLTCREIYDKTTFDAAVRYGPLLHELEIRFNHRSLCQLLHIVKIEQFRDRIVSLTLDPHQLYGGPDDLLDPSLPFWVRGEETESYVSSSEAVHLLAECFRWLAKAKQLTEVRHTRGDSLHVSLAALAAVRFTIKIDIVHLSLIGLVDQDHGDFGRSPATYTPYIKCLSSDGGTPSQMGYDDELRQALVTNEAGFHVQNYNLRHPAIASFFLGAREIAHLHIGGCKEEPFLRFCNACDDLFARNIAKVAFSNLTTFYLFDICVSGGRLRKFLKNRDHTLTRLRISDTALTDGSWMTIAQGLLKLPYLRQLELRGDLCQKGAVPGSRNQPTTYQPEAAGDDDVLSVDKVRHYLEFFIKHFSASRYIHSRQQPWPLPHYYKVDLYELPRVENRYIDLEPAYRALEKYVLQVEGKTAPPLSRPLESPTPFFQQSILTVRHPRSSLISEFLCIPHPTRYNIPPIALSALPPELLSRICRFISLEDGQHRCELPQRFKFLRRTCKEIYQKTLFDAGILYGGMLDHITIKLKPKSLNVLLAISNAPYFRDRARAIMINYPCGENSEIYRRKDYVCRLYCEELDAFANSPEAIYILAECFKNFAKSSSLRNVYMSGQEAHPPVFTALERARYSRQLVSAVIEPEHFRQSYYDRFLNPLSESPHLISQIKFRACQHLGHVAPEMREYDVEYNEHGRHYSDFKSVTSALSNLAAKLTGVEKITLRGCDDTPRLRLCHGCEDIWVSLFAKHTYPHLTHLELWDSYVSGGRLRGFIKSHASTLRHIFFSHIYLTDGSWRSIAQGIRKCPNLNYLDMGFMAGNTPAFGSLFQKHAAPPLADSVLKIYTAAASAELDNRECCLVDREKIADWLDIFVQYFTTRPHRRQPRRKPGQVTMPTFYEMRTFFHPDMTGVDRVLYPKTQASLPKERYFKGIEEG